ncbi:MAG: DUF6817 domain-containing protein [Oligoflexales bacterium]
MIDSVLNKLDKYNLQGFSHSDEGLMSHLKGTYALLKEWRCSEDLCLAGLCHSIYGTESYRKSPIELSERTNIRNIIGAEAEKTAYYFGAHVKDSLWANLEIDRDFSIFDRLEGKTIPMTKNELADLITLTLANWLEQRARLDKKHLFLRQDEFLRSEKYLSIAAFNAFKEAYGL